MRIVWYRGSWAIYTREDGRAKRQSLGTQDRADAERMLNQIAKGPDAETIGRIMALYIADAQTRLASPESAKFAWKRLAPHCETLPPEAITRAWSLQYTDRRRKSGAADGTISRELTVLRAGLRWHNPNTLAVIKPPPRALPRDRVLNRDEFERLVAACDAPHLKFFCELARGTAARSAAILALTWDRVDFDRKTIDLRIVDPTRRKGRAVVPITDRLMATITKHKEFSTTPWLIEYAGAPVKRIAKGFRAAAARGKLESVTPHTIRHSAAVWMAESGTSMEEIAQYLGHADARVTYQVYARYSPDYLRRAAQALE